MVLGILFCSLVVGLLAGFVAVWLIHAPVRRSRAEMEGRAVRAEAQLSAARLREKAAVAEWDRYRDAAKNAQSAALILRDELAHAKAELLQRGCWPDLSATERQPYLDAALDIVCRDYPCRF
jgi:hypothetical protein